MRPWVCAHTYKVENVKLLKEPNGTIDMKLRRMKNLVLIEKGGQYVIVRTAWTDA